MLQSNYIEENDEPQDKYIYILELENPDFLNDLSDEDELSENITVIKKCF